MVWSVAGEDIRMMCAISNLGNRHTPQCLMMLMMMMIIMMIWW